MIKKRDKKALSPVVATVMLIGLVVVIALVIFLWFRAIIAESVTKFGDENIELACGKVNFDADYSGSSIEIVNLGNVALYGAKLKIEDPGGSDNYNLGNYGITTGVLNVGGAGTADVSEFGITSGDVLTIIPILSGLDEEGEIVFFTCGENDGVEIIA